MISNAPGSSRLASILFPLVVALPLALVGCASSQHPKPPCACGHHGGDAKADHHEGSHDSGGSHKCKCKGHADGEKHDCPHHKGGDHHGGDHHGGDHHGAPPTAAPSAAPSAAPKP